MPKTSIIISFYNKIDYLKLVLAGLQRQSFNDFEIIIADDGSDQNSVKAVENISRKMNYQMIHLWQEDKKFRKNKILNKAIVASNSDYLIFIDGDCVPHKEFIREHFVNREDNVCLTGRRVNLSERLTNIVSEEKILNGYLDKNISKLIFDGLFGKSVDIEKGFYFKSKLLRKIFNKKKRGILGCNFSIYKKDIIAINGFDERYEAPSIGEDSDVQFRLELNSIKIKSLNNIAVQYHLYHKIQPRPKENLLLFEKVKLSEQYFAQFGINKPE
ncbi:MAG: glycosyltransferase [Ignavibacteriales bacterium]|nr:glycosyltransferase [Ignavibacteriales bacterium]